MTFSCGLAIFANPATLRKSGTSHAHRNVNLTEHFDKFIDSGITSGRFSNASEVVREGLRLLEQQEEEDKAKLEWLRAAAKKGFDAADRGEYTLLRSREELHSFMMDIHQQVAAKLAAKRKGA